jgi:hypothetical protein
VIGLLKGCEIVIISRIALFILFFSGLTFSVSFIMDLVDFFKQFNSSIKNKSETFPISKTTVIAGLLTFISGLIILISIPK